jgi:hypothetical protein
VVGAGVFRSAAVSANFQIGDQPMNASMQAFDYVAHPSLAPRWALRNQLQFLFPR